MCWMEACRLRVINPADQEKITALKELCERNGFLIDIVEEPENAVAENPHPAGEPTSGGVPEKRRNVEVHSSVSVSVKGDKFLKILTGLAAIAGATAVVYAAWKIGDGVDGWKRVGFPIQLKIEKPVIWNSLWSRS